MKELRIALERFTEDRDRGYKGISETISELTRRERRGGREYRNVLIGWFDFNCNIY